MAPLVVLKYAVSMRLNRLLFIVLALLSCAVFAREAPELPDGLKVFPLAEVDRVSSIETGDYRLVLGAVVKIDRQVRSDVELRLSGELDRISWEIPRSHEPQEAFFYFRDQLLDRGAQLLFECDGRSCGASNIWANDLFGNATLYGRDDTQRYMAAQLNGNHFAVYAVRRGNQRVYFHIDLLRSDQDAEQAWNIPLESQGYSLLPLWPESPDLAAQALSEWMKMHPGKVRVVFHQAGLDVELSQRKAERLAIAFMDRVLAEGIPAERIEVFGLGPLVPSVLGAKQQVAEVIWLRD